MRQALRPLGLALAAVMTAAAAGCTGEPDVAAAHDGTSAHATRTATSTPPTSAGPDGPQPGSMQTPAETAGPLSMSSFPRPREIGTGWAYAVDPGDVEEGYAGNGTPALARSTREVVQTAVPLGCPRPASMPLPEHALEVDYASPNGKVIAIRTSFGGRERAQRFFDARVTNLRACLHRTGGPAVGPLVGRLHALGPDATVSDRTPRSDPWTEVAVARDRTVMMVALQGDGVGTAEARTLAEAFGR